MKNFRLALCALFLLPLGAIRAQETPPEEQVITDFGEDDLLSVPKFTVTVGASAIRGLKKTFGGAGIVQSTQPLGDITTPNVVRTYHDGTVLPDTSPVDLTTTDSNGNATTIKGPVSAAGFTNFWNYQDAKQLTTIGFGLDVIQMHAYSAQVDPSAPRELPKGWGQGVEIAIARDLGDIGKKLQWKLIVGVSLNDIRARIAESVAATVTTLTDNYSYDLNGRLAAYSAPYFAPSIVYSNRPNPFFPGDATQTIVINGVQQTDPADSTMLLSTVPLGRTLTTSSGKVDNVWDLTGAYATFRLGPSFTFLISDRFRATVSVGAALVYASSEYDVQQVFVPETFQTIVEIATDTTSKFLSGYYADASLQFDVTERTGFYAGGFFQSTGSYTQTASIHGADYTSKVDLSSLNGFRMGMNYKF